MAWIRLNVDNLKEADSKEPEYVELEGILYQDKAGHFSKYKLNALLPTTTSYMNTNFPEYEWDIKANHVILVKGDKIKE